MDDYSNLLLASAGLDPSAGAYDTDATTNPGAAAGTSPVLTQANGQSASTFSLGGLLGGLNTLAQTGNQIYQQNNGNAAANNQLAAANASGIGASNNVILYVVLGVVALVAGLLFIRRK